jgi:hypothetical protein
MDEKDVAKMKGKGNGTALADITSTSYWGRWGTGPRIKRTTY